MVFAVLALDTKTAALQHQFALEQGFHHVISLTLLGEMGRSQQFRPVGSIARLEKQENAPQNQGSCCPCVKPHASVYSLLLTSVPSHATTAPYEAQDSADHEPYKSSDRRDGGEHEEVEVHEALAVKPEE